MQCSPQTVEEMLGMTAIMFSGHWDSICSPKTESATFALTDLSVKSQGGRSRFCSDYIMACKYDV